MRSKRKILIIALCVLGVAVLTIAVWALLEGSEKLSTRFKQSQHKEVIIYEGKEYRYNDHLSNYLFLGIDTKEAIKGHDVAGDAGQADAIFLVSYDRVKKTVRCLSIPRDTMAQIHLFAPDGTDLGYSKDHINIQYAFGDGKTKSCQLMKKAVETLLSDIRIDGYCAINMDGIPAAVEQVGGVELVVPDDSLEAVNPEFKQGATVMITKDNAEQFVRYRDITVSHSASTRANRQKVFMKAFADTAKVRSTEDADLVVDMYESLKPYMVTNIGNDVFAKLLQAEPATEKIFEDIPGKRVDGINFDEYHINEKDLYKLVLQMFYEEAKSK